MIGYNLQCEPARNSAPSPSPPPPPKKNHRRPLLPHLLSCDTYEHHTHTRSTDASAPQCLAPLSLHGIDGQPEGAITPDTGYSCVMPGGGGRQRIPYLGTGLQPRPHPRIAPLCDNTSVRQRMSSRATPPGSSPSYTRYGRENWRGRCLVGEGLDD